MRQLKAITLGICLILSLASAQNAQAQMDPKVKAIGMIAMYGTVGGTLLGVASLAFGTEGRTVAKGASIGLYAGLLFGSYVVISHAYRKHKAENPQATDSSGYYPDTSDSPYEEEEAGGGWFDFGGGGGDEEGDEEDPAQRWDSKWDLSIHPIHGNDKLGGLKAPKKRNRPSIYIPLYYSQF